MTFNRSRCYSAGWVGPIVSAVSIVSVECLLFQRRFYCANRMLIVLATFHCFSLLTIVSSERSLYYASVCCFSWIGLLNTPVNCLSWMFIVLVTCLSFRLPVCLSVACPLIQLPVSCFSHLSNVSATCLLLKLNAYFQPVYCFSRLSIYSNVYCFSCMFVCCFSPLPRPIFQSPVYCLSSMFIISAACSLDDDCSEWGSNEASVQTA